MQRQQRIGIRADGIEGDIAQIEKASEADDDIEAPAKHHIDENENTEIVDPFRHHAGTKAVIDDEREADEQGKAGAGQIAHGWS